MRRSTEARNLLAQMDSELAQSAAATGEQLEWSAAEAKVLSFIAGAVDRKCSLARDYDAAESPTLRVTISAEMRHLEKQVSVLLAQVRTDLPQAVAPSTATSTKARKAANTRWNAERARQAAGG